MLDLCILKTLKYPLVAVLLLKMNSLFYTQLYVHITQLNLLQYADLSFYSCCGFYLVKQSLGFPRGCPTIKCRQGKGNFFDFTFSLAVIAFGYFAKVYKQFTLVLLFVYHRLLLFCDLTIAFQFFVYWYLLLLSLHVRVFFFVQFVCRSVCRNFIKKGLPISFLSLD